MKETYIAPELNCLCLVPAEAVSRLPDSFDDYLGENAGNGISTGSVVIDPDDLDVKIS